MAIDYAGVTVATDCLESRLTCIMMPQERPFSQFGTNDHRPVEVRMPLQHEGIHRALKSSFDIPAMPDDMARLLARMR